MAAKQLTLFSEQETDREPTSEELKRERKRAINRAARKRLRARRKAKKLGLKGPPLRKLPNGSLTPEEARAKNAKRGRDRRARENASKPPKVGPTKQEKAEREKARRDGWSDEKKSAVKAYRAAWYQENKERKKEQRSVRLKQDREENNTSYQARLASGRKAYHALQAKLQSNPDLAEETRLKARAYANDYRRQPKYRAYANEAERRRMKTDIQFRFMRNLRDRVRVAIKAAAKKVGSSGKPRGQTTKMLGCSIPELMAHIESLFLPGMTWNNWNYRGWHLDHIKPLSSFNLLDPDERAKALHYTNLQPLWAEENFQKSGKTDWKPPLKKAA